MGHVYVGAYFYNPIDYTKYILGRRRLEDVRRISLRSLVDTGATYPALPEDIVEKLGLPIHGETEAETATGRERVKLALAIIQIEDRFVASYGIVRPREADVNEVLQTYKEIREIARKILEKK